MLIDSTVVIDGVIDRMGQHLYYERKFDEKNYSKNKEIKEYFHYKKMIMKVILLMYQDMIMKNP